MNYRFALSVLGLLGSATCASGQLRLAAGPRLGFSATTARYEAVRETFHQKAGPGGEVGGFVSLNRGRWAVQASGLYALKSFRLDDSFSYPPGLGVLSARYDETYRLHFLTMPLNVAYQLRADGQGLQVFGGGYAGRLLGGRVRYDDAVTFDLGSGPVPMLYQGSGKVVTTNQHTDETLFGADRPFYLRPWDLGAQAGLGYRRGPLLVQLCYSRGLRDLGPKPAAISGTTVYGPSYKLRGVQLSAVYLLGKAQ
jgi:Outer membrane protein beta-barrel domain